MPQGGSACRCLMDGVLTGSSSHILPRGEDNKLRIQLEAFRFQQESNGVVSPLRTGRFWAPCGTAWSPWRSS